MGVSFLYIHRLPGDTRDMNAADLPELVTRRQLAEYLGMTEPALSQMVVRGQGPRFLRFGRSVRYRREDVLAWLDDRVVDPAATRSA